MEIILFLGQSLFYDGLILSSVSYLTKKKIPVGKFIAAIVASLMTSLLIFLTVPLLLLVVPILTVKIAFSKQTLKQYGLTLLYFYGLSAFLSGILHILRYFVSLDSMHVGWFLLTTAVLAILIAMAFIVKSRFFKQIYTLRDFEHHVTFYCGATVTTGIGFVDTGNGLIDERTQYPVMVVPRSKISAIEQLIATKTLETWELGFSVVGEEEGKMLAFKPTLLLIDDIIVKDVVIGLCETNFANYDFLLQPEITIGRGVF